MIISGGHKTSSIHKNTVDENKVDDLLQVEVEGKKSKCKKGKKNKFVPDRQKSLFNIANSFRNLTNLVVDGKNKSIKSKTVDSTSKSIRKVQIFNDKSKANRITKQHYKQSLKDKDAKREPNMNLMHKDDDAGSEDFETIGVNLIDPKDNELVEIHLRDSLIKSFMVIFTNDKSQHLLLNKDLIDIAFNCLEFCKDCTLEAKRHVARLISIIFKFPQVQERLLAQEVVNGICHLLM